MAALLDTISSMLSNGGLEWFLSPKEYGYDFLNTTIYAVLLVIAVYLVYIVLKRLKVRIDERLAVAVSPYVVFGSCLRVIKDAGIVDSYLFVTPGIYFFVFSVFFAALFVSMVLYRRLKIGYHKPLFVIGLLTLPFMLSQLDYVNIRGAGTVVLLLCPWILLLKLIRWDTVNKIVTSLHMFDATTTFVAMSFFGYYEQHVLPTFIITMFGPFSFVIMKFVAIVGVLYLIDRFASGGRGDKEFSLYLKLIIGILGAATGTRDFVTLAAGI